MTPTELDAIEACARAATPERNARRLAMHGESLLEIGDQATTGRGLQMRTTDAEFHALASPTVVLSLINEVRKLQSTCIDAHNLIQRVILDEETGTGWGPDVTMKQYLEQARDILLHVGITLPAPPLPNSEGPP